MSLKAIEMQVALPRTQDAGKLQEQLQQRGQVMQDIASQAALKEEERKRTSVIANSDANSVSLTDKDQKGQQQQEQSERKHQKKDQTVKESHPYKGKLIDYSG
ncbi:hypothetical protein ACQCT6_08865 [Cytobacillus gottheilii]|uniref:RNA polymerase subunit sigma n=1 Tax=Cytobacillus gottheilii TaxID=859144 RepID=A0ABX8FH37_9BACI|nr:hypothetical protein [Cytobacillus gottheilii]QVY63314.1 hypothetical protein J1899_09800 [Cytobacillus gottheilii]